MKCRLTKLIEIMGRWMQVKCNCPNRKPLPGSQWYDEPYRGKHTTKQQGEFVGEWRKNIYQMCECGHREGMILQFTPSDLFTVGLALHETFKKDNSKFEIFRKIFNWRLYDDEYLSLTPDEVVLWQLEIELLKRYLSEEEFMGWGECQKWQRFWQSNELLYGDIEKTLEDGLKICQASLKTGNPIEFFW
jgi:hypothetical protein